MTESLASPNQHIVEFLRYYLTDIKESPGFAIMINGEWGSGKSFFVRELLETEFKGKYLFVSLYGITKYSEIESAFFEQLHPFLASKGAKMGASILKGLLKTTLKIDLSDDGKAEGTLSSQLPEVNLGEMLESSNSKFLVFDDLERCSIKINDVLGYINNFVENKGYKAIIIANEDEIIKSNNQEGNTLKYDLIKEKLIGQTFKIKPNFSDAYDHFLKTIDLRLLTEILDEEKETVYQIFQDSGFENIRLIKHLFFDFNRFFQLIPDFARKDEVFSSIFKYFVCFYIEFKKGTFGLEKMVEVIQSQAWMTSVDTTIATNIKFKYSVLQPLALPFSGKELHSFFSTGTFDQKEFGEFLKTTPYYFTPQTEAWRRLMYFTELEDHEFYPLVEEVFKKLKEKAFEDPFVILQVVGIFITLSKNFDGFKYSTSIFDTAKGNVDDLLSKQTFKIENRDWEDIGYGGFSYFSKDSTEFIQFKNWLFEEINRTYIKSYSQKADDLIFKLDSDVSTFCNKISYTESNGGIEPGEFMSIPIFSKSHSNSFYDKYQNASNGDKKLLLNSLKKRYSFPNIIPKLKQERPFVEEILFALESGLDFDLQPISSQRAKKQYIPQLNGIVKSMKEAEIQNS